MGCGSLGFGTPASPDRSTVREEIGFLPDVAPAAHRDELPIAVRGRPPLARAWLVALGLIVAGYQWPGPAFAAEPADLSLELNKLEPGEKGCRAYMVVDNRAETSYSAFKLDLVLFRPDGVIRKRLLLDLAPIKARKRTVKIFTIDDTPCDGFASILINDTAECRADTGPVESCLSRLDLKSLASAQLTK
jgi:hypothetical protein